jgi:DNA-binding transcriptional LysR family regulator
MSRAERDPINLNRLAYFATVVDTGSFTRAAERLGISKAVVSQQVARLEQELRVTLLLRTTRKVVPTDAGRTLHGRCSTILREAAEAFDELAENVEEPRGVLRVAAPFDFGSSIVHVIADFTRRFQNCNVELMLSDRVVDVQSVDVALRVGRLLDSSHQAVRIRKMEQFLVCAADVASRLKSVREPEELAGVPFILNASLRELDSWRFVHASRGRRTVRMHWRISVDATPAAHAAVLAGAGLSVLPDYVVASDLLAGRLVRVLPDWKLPSGGVHAVLPAARFRPAKVGRFLELMRADSLRITEGRPAIEEFARR